MGRYIISLFDYNRATWIQAVIVELVFLKILNFNSKGRHPYSHCHTKHHFDIFYQSGTLPGNENREVSPNFWNRNTFWASSLYAMGVHRQFQKRKLSNWICSPQLNWNWTAQNRASFFQCFWIMCKIGTFKKQLFQLQKLVLLICMHRN